jgi:hypothetical protein
MPACSNAPKYIRHENNGLRFLRYRLVELNRASQNRPTSHFKCLGFMRFVQRFFDVALGLLYFAFSLIL